MAQTLRHAKVTHLCESIDHIPNFAAHAPPPLVPPPVLPSSSRQQPFLRWPVVHPSMLGQLCAIFGEKLAEVIEDLRDGLSELSVEFG